MKRTLIAFLLSIINFISYSQNEGIVVTVNGFKTDKGKCLLYLYNSKKGFPTDADKTVKILTGDIFNGKSTILLKDIADGEYAITVIHDENGNGELDTNFIGMPKEGVGVSNNAKGSFGPPSYEDAKFQLSKKSLTLSITIKYL